MNEIRLKKLKEALLFIDQTEENILKRKHNSGFHSSWYNEKKEAYKLTSPWLDTFYIVKHKRFQPVDPHYHDFIEMSFVISGQVTMNVQGNTIVLQKGDVVMVDTNTVHSIGNTDKNDIMVNLLINKNYLKSMMPNIYNVENLLTSFFINSINDDIADVNYIIFNFNKSDRTETLLYELLYESYFPGELHQLILTSFFYALLADLSTVIDMRTVNAKLNRSSSTIIKALSYIDANYLNATLEDVARVANVNPSYLTSQLKKYYGKSCNQILIEKKMIYASNRLLNTSDSIENIINEIGYYNQSYFYKKFKEQFHCSPNDYRKKYSHHKGNERI